MKKLLFLILNFVLFEALAGATTLTAISDMPGEVGTVKFIFSDKGVIQDRKTNVISQSDQLWFGKTKPLQSPSVKKIQKSVAEISGKLKVVDNFLKSEKGEDRNSFLAGASHGIRFYVDDNVVLPGTRAFQDVSPLFEKLIALNWSLEEGMTISKNPLQAKQVVHGKSAGNIQSFECVLRDKSRVCHTPEYGPILLEQE